MKDINIKSSGPKSPSQQSFDFIQTTPPVQQHEALLGSSPDSTIIKKVHSLEPADSESLDSTHSASFVVNKTPVDATEGQEPIKDQEFYDRVKKRKFAVIDYGAKSFTCYVVDSVQLDEDLNVVWSSKEEKEAWKSKYVVAAEDLPNLFKSGLLDDLAVDMESTHFEPKNEYSWAQPLTLEARKMIKDACEERNIVFRQSSNKLSPTARDFFGKEKTTDLEDAICLAHYILKFPNQQSFRKYQDYDKVDLSREQGKKVNAHLSKTYNVIRASVEEAGMDCVTKITEKEILPFILGQDNLFDEDARKANGDTTDYKDLVFDILNIWPEGPRRDKELLRQKERFEKLMPAWEEGIKKGDLKGGENGDPIGKGATRPAQARKLGYEKPMKPKLPNLHYLKKTESNEKGDINTTGLTDCVLYSIVSCFIGKLEQTEDGELVISPKLLMTGKEDNQHLMTYNFFQRYIGITSHYHGLGGVIRSNINYHGFSNWVDWYASTQGVTLPSRKGQQDEKQRKVFTEAQRLYKNKGIKILFKKVREFFEARKDRFEKNYVKAS